jgi:LAS superfamily LD-carboxypeptidase LdcB
LTANSTKSVAFEYEINIKNKKKTAIDITIDDQIPLSANTNTEVELNDGSKADYVKETGALKWTSNIKSGESITHKFGFKVRYPKGFKITNLN